MRDRALHSILLTFTEDAARQLAAETKRGAEIPFELAEGERRPGGVPLYCYRPLTGAFIDERFTLLSALPSYATAARALAVVERVGAYLIKRGEQRVPPERRARGDLALRAFLNAVFADRSQFELEPERFELAFAELEEVLYEGQILTTVVAPLLGIALDDQTEELQLGDGLSLIRGSALEDAPAEAAWGERGEPRVLAMLAVAHDPARQPPLSLARTCFRRLLTSLRLFAHGGYALGPLGWTRLGTGPWRPVPFGASGRPGLPLRIRADQEDELRAFCNLVPRKAPTSGELAWALARFEMGTERVAPFEALTDYLLAAQALLEPEGLDRGIMPERMAAICVPPEQRARVTERIRRTIVLEREVIAGRQLAESDAEQLVDELSGYLRALLRDIICGHLGPDLATVADDLLLARDTETNTPVPVPAP